MHLFQTTNTTQTLFWSGINTWNDSSCRKYTWGEKLAISSRALMSFCISGACDHKVSLMCHSRRTLKRGLHLIPTAPRCSLSTSTKILQRKAAKEHWCSATFLINKRLTFAVLHIEHCTLYFCQRVPLTFTSNSRLRAPERMMWGSRLPKIGCLFISYVQSFRYRLLYLNIYISPERFAWNKMWRCLG